MPRKRRREIAVGNVLGLDKRVRRMRTSLPHRPLRWCYGLPLTNDPRLFIPDPAAASEAQIEEWSRAVRAIESGQGYRKPRRAGESHYEPWGLGVTVFPESRHWETTWTTGKGIPGSEI